MRALAALIIAVGAAGAEPADRPGHQPAAAPAPAMAYSFAWDEYRTIAVIGDGVGMHRPAWIVTWAAQQLRHQRAPVEILPSLEERLPDRWPRHLVAYRALAYRDARGRVHLDGRGALLSGPMAQDWSPDSFLFGPDGRVDTVDDDPEHEAHRGCVETMVMVETPVYRIFHQIAVLMVGGGI